jgi:YHS domain-containing protein
MQRNLPDRKRKETAMKKTSLIVALLTLIVMAPDYGWSEEAQTREGTQTRCPVMGGNIDKNIYTDYEGKRIYFCCQGCVETFKKDPEKYVSMMEKDGVVLESVAHAEEKCPVSGEPVDKAIYTEYEGTRVYFCCNRCLEEFKKDPEKYMKGMESHDAHHEKHHKEGCCSEGKHAHSKEHAHGK